MTPQFFFAICRPGSEPSLKKDVAKRHGSSLTPAFMRPQLITWKATQPLPADFEIDSPFARVSGTSLGPVRSPADIAARLQEASIASVCLHVFPREIPEDGVENTTWPQIDLLQADLRASLETAGIRVKPSTQPDAGDVVLDVIIDWKPEPAYFAGIHRHREGKHPHPGGIPRIMLPGDAPSRAWLKVEQALAWRGWDTPDLRGQTALDLGCAPGGATLALLDRGMRVIGVDTGEMDEAVLRHDGGAFRHLRMPVSALDPQRLTSGIDLILCDINLAPPEVLPHLERLQQALHARRLIITMKLNTPFLEARIDEFLRFIHGFAPAPVHITQLASNRREVCLTAGV